MPIPALNRSDGDITLILLAANSIVYEKPVTDPFFAASTLKPVILDDGTNLTYYAPYSLVSGIACMDQHQFCNPTNRKCTDLTSSTALGINNDQFRQLGFKRAQYATAQHINVFTGPLTTYSSVGIRGPNALRASETIHNDFFQIGLPNTQWMTEVSSWFAISMAKLQQKTLQYATGPPSIPEGYNFIGPRSWEEKRICDNQIIRSTSGTTSFSVLGVIIILVVGSILIVTSLLQDMVVPLIRGMRGKKNQYKTLQYVVDGTWQLQRLAYEEAGQGHWSGGADAVPVTRKDDKIGLPHNVNEKHPRLSQASTVVESNTSVAEADVLTMDPKGYGS